MPGTSTFKGFAVRAVPAAGWAGFLLIGLAMATSDPEPDASTFGLGVFLIVGSAALLVRIARAGVTLSDQGVRIRGFFRSRLLPWEDVEGAEVSDKGTLLPWGVLVIRTTDKEREVPEVAQLRGGGVADRAVEAIERWRAP